MAEMDRFIPFVIKWEAGVIQEKGETPKQLFERARRKGFANNPDDKGGPTQTGVTIGTYRAWCKKHHVSEPTIDNLKNIPYDTWKTIMKEGYWDKWRADEIDSQSVANMLVDFVWASGIHGIKRPQQLLGVASDGIVGPKTLSAVNSRGPVTLFYQLRDLRLKFVEEIVQRSPSQKKWLRGWRNRINDIKYE